MFPFPIVTEHRGQPHLHVLFQKKPPEVFFEKGILKNFAKFPRSAFLQNNSDNCFFLLLSSDDL